MITDQNTPPFIINENNCEHEKWPDKSRGDIKWKTLISGDKMASDGISCGIAELSEKESSLHLHQHAIPEVYYILQGKGIMPIDDKIFEVSTGSTIYIPNNALHQITNTSKKPLRFFYVFPTNTFSDVEYNFVHENK